MGGGGYLRSDDRGGAEGMSRLGYSPPTVARLPRSRSSSRIDCMRRSALPRPRLNQPRRPVTASMNLSVASAGSDSVETSTRVALPEGSSVQVVHVLLRLHFPARPAAPILYGRSTSMKVMSPQPKRSSGASILKRAPAP